MAADDTQRATPSVRAGITKPQKRPPPLPKVRAQLRLCLETNNFKMVPPIAMYFKQDLLPLEYRTMKLLAQCFENMGHEGQAKWCRIKAQVAKLKECMVSQQVVENKALNSPPSNVGRTSPLTPPRTEPVLQGEAGVHVDMDVDVKEEKEEEKEEEEEPLDSVDYATSLDDKIRRPSVTEEVLLSQMKSPSYERFENRSQMEMTVKMRLPLHRSGWTKKFGSYITGSGIAHMTRKDIEGGNRAFHNARNRAAKQAIDKLADMCKTIEDEAKAKLQLSLDNWLDTLRKEDYVDKCYQAFKRARDIIFRCSHSDLYSGRVFLYGSATTGLVLGDSDIDVAVSVPLPKSADDPKYMHAEMLAYLKKSVDRRMSDVQLIGKAKVPVLRYYDSDAQIDVDITIANDTSVLLSRVLRKHLKDDVRIWELCMAVKYWARQRRISGAPQGHINAMGWAIMVIYFLQHHATPRIASLYKTTGDDPKHAVIRKVPWKIPKRYGNCSAQTGELLLQFFKFFSCNFDFAHEAISINLQYPEQIHALTGKRNNQVVFIEQPLVYSVNVVDYVKASNMSIVMKELRRGYEICKTVGQCKATGEKICLFKRRELTEQDQIFGH